MTENGSQGSASQQPRRLPIVGGNWKMNTTLQEAVELAQSLTRLIGEVGHVEVVICPPFTNLHDVYRVIEASALQLGAQDVFWEASGPYTGEISPPMLTSVGCNWVIVGHSERRHIFNETNEIVNRKLHAALRHGLRAILAVGETRDERLANRMDEVLEQQLTESLANIAASDMDQIVLAYEPVWAIGTGETATPDQAREAHAHIRIVLAKLYGPEIAQTTRVQYGGSVTSKNAAALMAQPGIDGALVGGSCLKPDEFAAIVQAAAAP